MLNTKTGVVKMTLTHEGNNVLEFYRWCVWGSMQWFMNLMEELGIECQVGHPAKIRSAEPRKQKHNRQDVDLILKLLMENRQSNSLGADYGGRGDSNPRPLLAKQETRLQQFHWKQLSNNVSNKSGNLLSLKS
jgi:hypothetical protein